jgi:hypothetical protein
MRTESFQNAQKINVVKAIHTEFENILKHEKCRTCSCLYGEVLNGILEKIKAFNKNRSNQKLARIESDFERWMKEADVLKMHG